MTGTVFVVQSSGPAEVLVSTFAGGCPVAQAVCVPVITSSMTIARPDPSSTPATLRLKADRAGIRAIVTVTVVPSALITGALAPVTVPV